MRGGSGRFGRSYGEFADKRKETTEELQYPGIALCGEKRVNNLTDRISPAPLMLKRKKGRPAMPDGP